MIREFSALILGLGLSLGIYLLTQALAKNNKPKASIWPLLVASVFFIISRYLPDLNQITHNSTFVQHAVGGGMVSLLLFLYMKKALRLKMPIWQEILALYIFTSALGVANELLEFFVTQSGIYKVDGSDVWWDLTANTLGALVGYIIYLFLSRFFKVVKP